MRSNDDRGVTPRKVWADILPVWKSGQVGLQRVRRWSKYHRENGEKRTRPQNSLQHSYSIAILGHIFCHKVRPYVPLDEALLQSALLVHDHGEGEILSDTLYIDKNEKGDLDEYRAFVERYSALPGALYDEFHKAFLLQFALKNPVSFPEAARALMSELAVEQKWECLAFEAVERWDYVLYALEQFHEYKNEKILVQTMRHQVNHLDRLAKELPGFREEIWTRHDRLWFHGLLAHHKGAWREQKGEK